MVWYGFLGQSSAVKASIFISIWLQSSLQGNRFGEESLWMLGWGWEVGGRCEGREEGVGTLHVASVPERHIALAGSWSAV